MAYLFKVVPLSLKTLELLWNADVANKKIANITFKQPYDVLSKVENKSDFDSMRRVRDSNPRYRLRYTRFPSERTRPLCELSFYSVLFG